MGKKISLGIIDDHDIVRKGIKELLHNMGDFEVIEEHANGVAFLNNMPEKSKLPDLYLLDYSMPMMNGIEVLKEVKKIAPDAKFLLLTQHLDDPLKVNAYDNGARGFLNKTCTAQQLDSSIKNVVRTGYDNFDEILKLLRNKNSLKELNDKQQYDLTDRELQLLELVCHENEYTYQQIADQMNLSIKSVDACRAQLFQKIGVKSKVGLVLYSFHHKLTQPFN
ncbi:LuxR family two component transcriptional regulator [Nonlabens dokdonensis]|jgi:DNA-binding NarL/FixJ family response regulator|uniref:Two component transcriptional regulator, LuxR family n=2 Tax=Nonlabens dokdonensis TaxID=328515 RepID=L7W778_NONDD|nr:response regulator transcription factor [Nonlabens dokdonensis]AGC77540.1 two component transcriptional regulator, LuxR family [Nonlabens dokdonensis DSW-6]PZX39906.1 LuxR family two component transcriptional regulator [Nonlabens dokdonensis]